MRKLETALAKKDPSQDSDVSSGIICALIREGAPTLLLISWEGKRWVMPWVHFHYAWHERESEFERIKLCYSSHDVSLEGLRLERLVEPLSKYGVEWIRSYEKRYLHLCPQDFPFVERILIEQKDAGKFEA